MTNSIVTFKSASDVRDLTISLLQGKLNNTVLEKNSVQKFPVAAAIDYNPQINTFSIIYLNTKEVLECASQLSITP